MPVRSQRFTWFDGVVLSGAVASIALLAVRFLGAHGVVRNDFATFWTVSHLLRQGALGEIYDPPRIAAHYHELFGGRPDEFPRYWPYPPMALFLMAPLALLPSFPSYLVWCLATLALFAASVRAYFGDNRRVLMLALAPSSCANIVFGQTGFVASALLVGGLALLERRPLLAGLLLGLLAFKPQLGIMLPLALAAARLWRPFLAAAFAALAAAVASVAVFGIAAWRDYFELTIPFELNYAAHGQNPFIQKAPTIFVAARLLGAPANLGYLLQATALVAVAAIVIWAFGRRRDRELQAGVLLAGTALASPHIHVYDLSLVSVAAVALAEGARARAPGLFERATIALAWLAPVAVIVLSVMLNMGVPHAPYALASLSPLITAALLCFLVARSRQMPAAA